MHLRDPFHVMILARRLVGILLKSCFGAHLAPHPPGNMGDVVLFHLIGARLHRCLSHDWLLTLFALHWRWSGLTSSFDLLCFVPINSTTPHQIVELALTVQVVYCTKFRRPRLKFINTIGIIRTYTTFSGKGYGCLPKPSTLVAGGTHTSNI